MALPRLVTGQSAGVSDYLNAAADEIDRLGAGCVVRRTGYGILPSSTDTILDWQALSLDTSTTGMWSPDAADLVTIRVPGVYLAIAQCRFSHYVVSGNTGAYNNGPPYSAGQRAIRLLLNGTSVAANTIGSAKLPTSVDGEGLTLSLTVSARFAYGDQLRLSLYQNGGGTIQAAQGEGDFGGTYLCLTRSGPY